MWHKSTFLNSGNKINIIKIPQVILKSVQYEDMQSIYLAENSDNWLAVVTTKFWDLQILLYLEKAQLHSSLV
jgi:hypothetical protein